MEESEYHLWRGLVEASREVGRWSGLLHASVGDGEACQDHDDLMELYAAGRVSAEAPPEEPPALPPEPGPPAAEAAEELQPPAEGFE